MSDTVETGHRVGHDRVYMAVSGVWTWPCPTRPCPSTIHDRVYMAVSDTAVYTWPCPVFDTAVSDTVVYDG